MINLTEEGLHPIRVAIQVCLPEIDGIIEPVIVAGREGATGCSIPLAHSVNLLADRALKWSNLRIKKNADKKMAITIFSFPPDKGNVGTAAYLDVFDSILAVLKQMKSEGYDIGDAPMTKEEIMEVNFDLFVTIDYDVEDICLNMIFVYSILVCSERS